MRPDRLVSEHLGARWGLIAGGLAVIVVATAAGAALARGRQVRLELHVAPPSVHLHVAGPDPHGPTSRPQAPTAATQGPAAGGPPR